MPNIEFTPPIEVQTQIDGLRKLMTTEEPTANNIRTAWVVYQDILKKIASSPVDRVSLAQVNQFVDTMNNLALSGKTVQSNSGYASAMFSFSLDTLGYEKKGGRFFNTLNPEQIIKLTTFVGKLGSVVSG